MYELKVIIKWQDKQRVYSDDANGMWLSQPRLMSK